MLNVEIVNVIFVLYVWVLIMENGNVVLMEMFALLLQEEYQRFSPILLNDHDHEVWVKVEWSFWSR